MSSQSAGSGYKLRLSTVPKPETIRPRMSQHLSFLRQHVHLYIPDFEYHFLAACAQGNETDLVAVWQNMSMVRLTNDHAHQRPPPENGMKLHTAPKVASTSRCIISTRLDDSQRCHTTPLSTTGKQQCYSARQLGVYSAVIGIDSGKQCTMRRAALCESDGTLPMY